MSPRVSAGRRQAYLQERRERLLDAALEAFGAKGFDGASVEDVARAAGVAKGTVYLYFKSKEAIFSALLSERTLIPWLTERLAAEDVPIEAFLTEVGEHYLQALEDYQPIMRLVLADSGRQPAHARQLYRDVVLKGNEMLADYLAAQAQAGAIRPLENPLLTARAFMGMLVTYVITQELLGGKHFVSIKPQAWVREVVRLFLDGVRPQGG